jgi:hypothetical protein
MVERREGSQFMGYVPNGTVITGKLISEMQQGRGARQPFDLDLKANVIEPNDLKIVTGSHPQEKLK